MHTGDTRVGTKDGPSPERANVIMISQPKDPKTAMEKMEEQERRDGYDAAAREITLSPALMGRLPKSVREWTTEEAVLWLQEVFAMSEDLPR